MSDTAREPSAGRAAVSRHDGRPALRRTRAGWRLAFRAWRLVAWVRWSLWRAPYARVRADLLRRRVDAGPAQPIVWRGRDLTRDPRALAWAVAAAARRVPKASCLTQSLALETLLAQAGQAGELRIGVARKPDGAFEAHAWVEHDGRVLIGDLPDLRRFSTFPAGSGPLDPA